jgi:hypothetical protein
MFMEGLHFKARTNPGRGISRLSPPGHLFSPDNRPTSRHDVRRVPPLYQPFFCEENIWHLAQSADVPGAERLVLVISGEQGVACWHQKAGDEGAPILWDYHVVLAARDGGAWQLWDLDGRLGYPVPAEMWLRTTFPMPDLVPARYQPRFAVIPAAEYVRTLGTDRSHMRDAHGGWLKAPPPWPAPAGHGLTLPDAVAQARQGLDLAGLRLRIGDVSTA